jgi:hypothetical protein
LALPKLKFGTASANAPPPGVLVLAAVFIIKTRVLAR